LQQGVFGSWYPDPGLEYDVLRPTVKITLKRFGDLPSLHPHCLLTDGDWLWPSVLLYYVFQYHLQIDADFIDHARANQWIIKSEKIDIGNLCWDAFEGIPPGQSE
jgi:hypothetical protein